MGVLPWTHTYAFSRPLYLYTINPANGVTFIFMQIIFSTYTKKKTKFIVLFQNKVFIFVPNMYFRIGCKAI